MSAEIALKSRILDEKDRMILMLLQENSRETLTSIAKKVHLSIDSVNNRIKELQRKGVFSFTISIDPRIIGYAIVADVKIKLQNLAPKAKDSFVAYLVRHANVTDVLGIVGDFDITCVIVAKDTKELDEVSNHIRERFSSLIADWKTVLVTRTYKFDTYTLE